MVKSEIKLQHVQVPNNMCLSHELEPFDLFVYATVKRFMNSVTREAWPSMQTLKGLTGSGQDKIAASITKLNGKYFDIIYKDGRKKYVFSKRYRNFEPFSKEFLDKQDLTPLEKSYLIAAQQYMFKDMQDFGKISFSAKELAVLINMPEWAIYKCDRELQKKGYLSVVKTKNRDFNTGLPLTEKMFNMEMLGQKIIWMLTRNNERIKKNNDQLLKLQKDLKIMKKLLIQKDRQIHGLSSTTLHAPEVVVKI